LANTNYLLNYLNSFRPQSSTDRWDPLKSIKISKGTVNYPMHRNIHPFCLILPYRSKICPSLDGHYL
jgi:hypothetical protein